MCNDASARLCKILITAAAARQVLQYYFGAIVALHERTRLLQRRCKSSAAVSAGSSTFVVLCFAYLRKIRALVGQKMTSEKHETHDNFRLEQRRECKIYSPLATLPHDPLQIQGFVRLARFACSHPTTVLCAKLAEPRISEAAGTNDRLKNNYSKQPIHSPIGRPVGTN